MPALRLLRMVYDGEEKLLHNTYKKMLIARKLFSAVANQPDNTGFTFGEA